MPMKVYVVCGLEVHSVYFWWALAEEYTSGRMKSWFDFYLKNMYYVCVRVKTCICKFRVASIESVGAWFLSRLHHSSYAVFVQGFASRVSADV
jgi:hypothetical protein